MKRDRELWCDRCGRGVSSDGIYVRRSEIGYDLCSFECLARWSLSKIPKQVGPIGAWQFKRRVSKAA